MGFASYAIISTDKGWGILHDGEHSGLPGGSYVYTNAVTGIDRIYVRTA